eukprot:2019656-Pyramimonas_sp.AAC.1
MVVPETQVRSAHMKSTCVTRMRGKDARALEGHADVSRTRLASKKPLSMGRRSKDARVAFGSMLTLTLRAD